ncbi:MAG: TetR/AcrR family transcriptional regulator [Paludibacteraceae bacterium]|nr:TetR/AcrR family transcriptional regulator [Paludibacteraceae bacterium]
MGISRTRQMLVDVARQLFAKSGKNNVTMNDIATASQKGRRTLYTYFKNKNDIYLAVIEREMNLLLEKLEAVIIKNAPPDEMLVDYIFTRQDAIKESVTRNGSLRSDFFRDIYEVERVRRRFDIMETKMIKSILDKGVEQDIFRCVDTELASMLMLYSLKGIETPFIRDRISKQMVDKREQIVKFLFEGLKKRKG